jgi:uncharacterized protein HemY
VNRADLDALAYALLAQAVTQMAVHFPHLLKEMGVPIPNALAKATNLAEKAIAQAPMLPDGHTALGRLLLIRDEPEALDDAIEILRHAVGLAPEHDLAELALATALRARGDPSEALDLVNNIIRRGSGLAQPFVLRALLAFDIGDLTTARRDLERAVMLAPQDGLVHLDAARVAARTGDHDAAEIYTARARELLSSSAQQLMDAIFAEPLPMTPKS